MSYKGTLQIRKRTHVKDLSQASEATFTRGLDEFDDLLGWNNVNRAGIAADTELGLPKDKWVLVPTFAALDGKTDFRIAYTYAVSPGEVGVVCNQNDSMYRQGTITNDEVADMLSAFKRFNSDLAAYTDGTWAADKKKYDAIAARQSLGGTIDDEEQAILDDGDPGNPVKPVYTDYFGAKGGISNASHVTYGFKQGETTKNLTVGVKRLFAAAVALNRAHFNEIYAGKGMTVGQIEHAAYVVAQAWRMGLLESGKGAEYHVVQVAVDGAGVCTVAAIEPAYALTGRKAIAVGNKLFDNSVKLSPELIEIAGGTVVAAGYNHYSMNHTTGGIRVNGPMAAALVTNNLYIQAPSGGVGATAAQQREIDQTDLLYNCAHPVNKRGVAAMCIPTSHVVSFHVPAVCPRPRLIERDAFFKIRERLSPAGSHKVYIASAVFARICDSSLSPFIPWYDQADALVALMTQLSRDGASAHPGARYYMDKPCTFSQSEVDAFLPDLAYYVQTKMKNHSFAFSPHMSPENAGGVDSNWKNIVDMSVTKATAVTDPKKFNDYLQKVGAKRVTVNLDDDSTWDEAAQAQKDWAADIRKLIGSSR